MESKLTASEVIQNLPFRAKVQGKIYLIGCLGYMFDAWDILLPAYVIPLLAKSWHLGAAQLGLFGTAGLAGMAIGAFAWGSIADLIGRRVSFMLTLLVYALFSLLCAASPSFGFLLAMRFISGLGLGGFIPIDYSMISEFMPKKYRGMLLTSVDIWWPIGGALAGFFSLALLPYHNWRLLFLVMILPAILAFVGLIGAPESPLFLFKKGKYAEAKRVVEQLIKHTGANTGNWTLSMEEAAVSERKVPQYVEFFGKFKEVWQWNWRVTLSVWLIFISNLFLYYGVMIWLPGILTKSGYSTYSAFLETTLVTVLGVIGSVVAMLLVEITGRKFLIILGGVAGGLAMMLFAVTVRMPAESRFWLMVFGFASEIVIPVMYAWGAEVYPTLIRGSGLGWASTASRVVAAFVPYLFGSLLFPVLGLAGTFTVSFVFVIIGSLAALVWGIETKGRELA